MKLPEHRPALMGILNVTPDSFSDGGRHNTPKEAIERALEMIDEGADLIDVGGESTRPGAEPVPLEEELRRVIPVVEALASKGVYVSVDTMKPDVAWRALQAGADIINDVNGLRNPDMLSACADSKGGVCIMHMKGEPRTMQQAPKYENVVKEVHDFLLAQAEAAVNAGIPKDKVWIDPGIGFGKTIEHNLTLLKNLSALVATGYPVLIGVSRKSFIGKLLGNLPPEDRLEGTLAVQAWAQIQGAKIIRAHDITQARRVIDMVSAMRRAS